MQHLWPVLRFVIFYSIGHGIILVLSDHGIYPDRWVARMIGSATDSAALSTISWVLAGIFALAITTVWEALHVPTRTKSAIQRATGRSFKLWGSEPQKQGFSVWPDPYNPIMVLGRTFRNEKVLIDGHSYRDCKFYNVTFLYNGTTPIQITHSEIGSTWVESENPAVIGTFILLRSIGFLREDIAMPTPPGVHIEPLRSEASPRNVPSNRTDKG
jgi:hypothetical protein